MSKSRADILKDIGAPKASTQRRREGRVSKRTTLLEDNNRETKEISRAVMRHPDSEVIKQLEFAHKRMAESFSSMSDEALTWLLGGSSEMARGGFQDSKTQTAAQKFREFLKTDPSTIPPQRLITGIESIGTAMGYRAIRASWVEPPFAPETPDQQIMDDKIQEVMGDKLTKSISTVYTIRAKDDLVVSPAPGSREIMGEQEDVSSASENEEEDQIPRKLIDTRKFRSEVRPGHYSWIGAAVDGGIEVRGHTSGTCALTLSAIDGLCSSGKEPRSTWLDDQANFEALAGALTVAPFQRGDYHTIAETAAGVNHYLVERAIKKGEDIDNTPMQPYDAFKYGMSMLVKASSTDKALSTDSFSIREAVEAQADEVMSRTTRLKAKMREYNPQKPQEFYEDSEKGPKVSMSSRFADYKTRYNQTAQVKTDVDNDDTGYESDTEDPVYSR